LECEIKLQLVALKWFGIWTCAHVALPNSSPGFANSLFHLDPYSLSDKCLHINLDQTSCLLNLHDYDL